MRSQKGFLSVSLLGAFMFSCGAKQSSELSNESSATLKCADGGTKIADLELTYVPTISVSEKQRAHIAYMRCTASFTPRAEELAGKCDALTHALVAPNIRTEDLGVVMDEDRDRSVSAAEDCAKNFKEKLSEITSKRVKAICCNMPLKAKK